MTEEEPQHWPTERMITEGHSEFALPADLEALDSQTLSGIASICQVKTYAPDECVPCLANVIIAERIQAAEGQESAGPGEESIPFEDANSDLLPDVSHSLKEQILQLVAQLPPVEVTGNELAILVVATQKWVAVTEAQGNELSPSAQQFLDAAKSLVSRLNHG